MFCERFPSGLIQLIANLQDRMDDANQLDQQQKPGLNECLKQLADILKSIGVEELTIEHDFQYYLINERSAPKQLIEKFCTHITEMYQQIVDRKSTRLNSSHTS